ncbi:MAG: protein tyrosine phosphatase family protein [Casimicrobiaceae bacterium]|nr:protein tyrosine phosphatase family protein [Casimicrobiaceae bacterium]MCX8099470.1 protein tyrosine phosphatase family protein [Casimicrobiaceae bacterium]MDW8312501.1 protein tyrosine phosphatase family protein [Burkholderiales bacterium]
MIPTQIIDPAGDRLVIAGQIRPEHVAEIAQAGFKTIINNRPDGEEGAVPAAEIEAEAKRHGLTFISQPVLFSKLTAEDGAVFARWLETAPKPIFAYCRTGRRCAALWALARAPERGTEAVLRAAREAGCDLEELRPRLPA